jgi:5'-methylthioadenosine phosphorylase
MTPVGVILGSSATGRRAELAADLEDRGATTVQRHGGAEGYVLPHRIDHAANVNALLDAGCEAAIGVCSVGSLREEITVGSLIFPDDFIALTEAITTFDDARAHLPPGFDPEWRARVVAAASAAEVADGGVYWQARGPRFETPAEIRMITAHAHLIGMTMASECIVAGELGLPYAAICAVDNMANGIGAGPLSVAEMEAVRDENAGRLRTAMAAILTAIGAEETA